MGKETGFNRRNKPYIETQRLKKANKRVNSTKGPVSTIKPTVSDKKLRREAKKMAIKAAKKDAKRQKANRMSVEEDGDFEDVE